MNFQDLHKIENAAFYLDRAFKESKKEGEKVFVRTSGAQFFRIRKTEQEKLKKFTSSLTESLNNIIKKFPSIDSLPEFYTELIKYTLDYDLLKKSLGSLKWCVENIIIISRKYAAILYRIENVMDIKKTMNSFYGRISSLLKQVNKNLEYIDKARKTMREFPALKTDIFTVAITGFPNIGKSTLLSRITPARPEIKDYAFTTKRLNLGYANYDSRKVQFIDTPGVLARDLKNPIEMQAYLVLKYQTNLIIYVIDLTETYPLAIQKKLLKELKGLDKPLIIYLSKTDIMDKKQWEKSKKTFRAVATIDDLNKRIEKEIKKYYFE